LVRYGAFVKERGVSLDVPVVDMNAPLIGLLTKAQTSDPELARKMIPDRTHPGPAGQLAMAAALLKAWNAPRTVSNVEIDAANDRVVHADNTSIASINSGDSISWEQTDKALPFPIDWNDAAIAFAARTMNIVESFNQEPLSVTGLTAARYKLSVDGEEVHSFSREELAAGVNLALFDTPMLKQAWRVYGLTLKRNDVHFGLWRRVQVPLEQEARPEKQAALDALTQLEEDVVLQQRAAAQPKTHRFELIPE
jgi:hypothetical protein